MKRGKYAAIGESVKIVTPRQFIRCGYPLSIKDVMNRDFQEIEEDFARVFAALENRPLLEKESGGEANRGIDWRLKVTSEQSSASATVHGMLCAAIAAYRLE